MPPSRALSLTLEEKLQTCLKAQREARIKDGELLLWASGTIKKTISISIIRRIRSKQPSHYCNANSSATRRRRIKFPELEQQLVDFFHRHEDTAIISDDLLLVKAGEIKKTLNIGDDQLRLSNGWLAKFKKRNGISSKRLHGEADSASAVEVRTARYSLHDITRQYRPEDIYNFDETALFYRLAPNQTLASTNRKGKKCDKARITIAFCCNATGTHKMDPLIIGSAVNLRCFQGGAQRALAGKPVVIDCWGDVTSDCIRNCWVKTRFVDAALLGEVHQDADYALAAEQKVIDDLASMLQGVRVSDYLEIDSEVVVHEIPEAGNEASAVREADDTGANDEHEDDRNDPPPVSASIALAYCMELSSFLFQCEGDT
ncbi:unnamed protein product [Phytophthora fragariaefolia]|uniref:Unnamed protein product n=1 Tax=Phytophthora fragariaefolia TaxID=1490495 RepID=A0A9W7CUM2_9STRA|nr:unnamed protein product [Phytophthora fragariaefolia]